MAMITATQIREARKLLGWSTLKLAGRAKIHSAILRRAEGVEGEPPLTGYQHALIRNALQVAGIEFTNDDGPGVRLKVKP
jgi:ribosome-binding protein aMBF1 (putative translation factor)